MSDSGYYKCLCESCRGHLEFPAHAAGITTTCPHCGVETKLVAPDTAAGPSPPPPPPPAEITPDHATPADPEPALEPAAPTRKSARGLNLVGTGLVVLATVGWFGWKAWVKYRQASRVVATVKGESKTEPATADAPPSKPAAAPAPPAPATSVVLATGTPPARPAGADLQVISFEVHKAKDGNLQYIVGVVTNHAAKQYFNVKLTFGLTRQGGKTGDTATDTLRNLPANVGSTFKVNIIGTTPVSAATLTKLEGEKE